MYIAHTNESTGKQQVLIDHLTNTGELARDFADTFNNSEFGYVCGLLHDIGKYSEAFQKRIKENTGKCDHSTAGSREIMKLGIAGKLLSYCIAGHHSGLLNSGSKYDTGTEGTLYARLGEDYIVKPYNSYKNELNGNIKLPKRPDIKPLCKLGFSYSFFIRMLYSCLVDADFLDTEKFMSNGEVKREIYYSFSEMLDKLNQKVSEFGSTHGIINEKRAEILDNCIRKSANDRGLFTLTVPTGGGKTLSSMAFALNHLENNKMDRIIYVIPYTSIIEQNAKVFSDVLGNQGILEHHSNYDFNNSEDNVNDIKKLASENWNMPVIVTTNVQFFESLYANKSSRCRKLHNIANSVIIFDEVQMLPTEYLLPCIRGISELVYNYKCTAVLCSATQPAILEMFPKELKATELCENTEELYSVFKRSKIIERGCLESQELAAEIMSLNQCLTIVNTRKHALKLFTMLSSDSIFHLSTLMCPVHRKKIIDEIRLRLKDGRTCRVVSTRLIEAGVDVDFPRVYRSLAGLDSIIQSAGRCNREGRLRDEAGNLILGEVHVFKPEQEFIKGQPPAFKLPIEATDEISRLYPDDITSPNAIKAYFEKLYFFNGKNGLDTKDIVNRLEAGVPSNPKRPDDLFNYDFADIAGDFKYIDDNTHSVIIPYDKKAEELIESLRYAEFTGGILRSLQGYTVNIFDNEFKALNNAGKLDFVLKDITVLRSMGDYSENTGLSINIESGIGIFY